MEEVLFHSLLRNICLFISLSFICLTYVNTFPKVFIRRIILSISLIFLSISYLLNSRADKMKNKIDNSLQRVPKLIFIVQIILLFYILNLLIFKKMK